MYAIISSAIFPGRKEDGGLVSRHVMKTKECPTKEQPGGGSPSRHRKRE